MSELLGYIAFLLVGFGLGGLAGLGLAVYYFKRRMQRMMNNPMQAAGNLMEGLMDDDLQDS